MLSGVIFLEELQKAIQSLQGEKLPGLDGFPMDFYKCFSAWLEGESLAGVVLNLFVCLFACLFILTYFFFQF